MSTRDGNPEIYVANRDGSNARRITNHPAGDVSCTWSPSGTQIAFVSDRSGSPQLYIVGADGTGLTKLQLGESYVDRPTWSPPPFNEIAFAARTTSAGFDIKVFDFASGQVHALTFGEGTNESPAWSPNGRHLAFSSTRAGQIADLHGRPRREERPADHAVRQQLHAGLVKNDGANDGTRFDRLDWRIVGARADVRVAGLPSHKPPVARPPPPWRRRTTTSPRSGRRRRRSRSPSRPSCRPSRCGTMRSRRRRSTT